MWQIFEYKCSRDETAQEIEKIQRKNENCKVNEDAETFPRTEAYFLVEYKIPKLLKIHFILIFSEVNRNIYDNIVKSGI
jgi:hypothetical protein